MLGPTKLIVVTPHLSASALGLHLILLNKRKHIFLVEAPKGWRLDRSYQTSPAQPSLPSCSDLSASRIPEPLPIRCTAQVFLAT